MILILGNENLMEMYIMQLTHLKSLDENKVITEEKEIINSQESVSKKKMKKKY